MKLSKKRKVTAALFAAATLGSVAHAAPVLNMNDLVGANNSTESTTQQVAIYYNTNGSSRTPSASSRYCKSII